MTPAESKCTAVDSCGPLNAALTNTSLLSTVALLGAVTLSVINIVLLSTVHREHTHSFLKMIELIAFMPSILLIGGGVLYLISMALTAEITYGGQDSVTHFSRVIFAGISTTLLLFMFFLLFQRKKLAQFMLPAGVATAAGARVNTYLEKEEK